MFQRFGENSTYLTTAVSSSPCQYTICRVDPSITTLRCHNPTLPTIRTLRLDFDTLELAPPFTCGDSSSSPACGLKDGPLIGAGAITSSSHLH